MGRSKDAEKTKKLILQTASTIMMDVGYENMTIKNILDETGLSKGALYHHFKSKDEIIDALWDFELDGNDKDLDFIKSSKNGKEKLYNIFLYLFSDEEKIHRDAITKGLLKNPRHFIKYFKSTFEIGAVKIENIIIEGNNDGSLNVVDTKQASEVVVMMLNFWINPLLSATSNEDYLKRINLFKKIMELLGLDIFDDKIISLANKFANKYYENMDSTSIR